MRPTGLKADRAARIISIQWDDGHTSVLAFKHVADNCRCATCNDTRAKLRLEGRVFEAESSVLAAIEAVGSYGVAIAWEGGCRHGIFTWEYLRELDHTNPNTDGPVALHSAF